MLQTVQKQRFFVFFLTPSGLFRQDSDRLLQGVIGGPPSKKHGFGKVLPTQTMLSPIFEKKVRNPPSGPSFGGGPALFFLKIGDSMVWEGNTFPKPCFLEGGAYNPL